ncbi:LEM3 (ligand-effect modulator 3) family / CDC50 family [Novymonas esmeraldas]|uniref:LEM3 (Ligand-effect modulator 3) family / CDC50 family n=1 Tax=Novymonas esmeraldas TaxID=1808958 RepID=A0AAW0F319_9TRYP
MSNVPPKPHSGNRVEQQQLPHVYATHSPLSVAVVFFILAIAAVPIGVVVIVTGARTARLDYRYDHINKYKYTLGAAGEYAVDFPFNGSVSSAGVKTQLTFSLSRSLTAPVYIQYRLYPFFQSYRWFGASVDRVQLRGGKAKVINDCHPYRYPGEAAHQTVSGYYSPCGAYPWSLFNDSISLYKSDGTLVCDGGSFTADGKSLVANNNCRKTGIALKKDVDNGFRAPAEIPGQGPMWSAAGDPSATDPYQKEGYYYGEPGHKIPSSLDEDLMVWLNPAYMSGVANTYRIVEVDLPAGDYYFEITEQYATSSHSIQKYVELATRSWVGGESRALGILLIALGGVAFILAVALLILQCFVAPGYTK